MPADLGQLEASLESCMLLDRERLGRRLRGWRRRGRGPRPSGDALARLEQDVADSIARRRRRAEQLPRPTFDDALPIAGKRRLIAEAVAEHPVIVVCGETGSGKTTQLPKICLGIGRGVSGLIGHTQPRRIAARSVAARIAHELESPLGRDVGYQVRFSDRTGPDAFVKLMTDGILLAETQSDRRLLRYDTIIIDEAHERSLNIDFLLGYLRQLMPRRPDLKIIITSATIDPERFSAHFDDAPIIEVSGRTYPVEIRHQAPALDDSGEPDLQRSVVEAIDTLATLGAGDVLVFLSGEREIRETAETLRKHHPPHTEILPLYARLSAEEQNRVFQPHPGRRIVLATNVAETSLTVPGIKYVVDPGFARISRYSARRKVQLLPVEAISQASAAQRAGRCGRLSDGVCVRLYDQDDFERRPEHTDPEILRTSLASVILQMHALGLGAIEQFPFMDPPRRTAVADGYRTLHELGALDDDRGLTDLGRRLARLPIDPRLGRMLLAADATGCLAEVLVIAAALSAQDPRERPHEAADRADEAHAAFRHETSDFLAYLNLWSAYQDRKRHLSWNKLRRWCREQYLSFVRMREWADLHTQLKRRLTETGLHLNAEPAPEDVVHRALLTGLLSNIAQRGEGHAYNGAGGKVVHIFPGSGLFKAAPPWIVAAELVETTRLYARTVAAIRPQWLEELAPHLVSRSHSEPRWEMSSARVVADERVSLFGLTIVPRRVVHYGPVDPVTSRDLFIHHALAEGEYETDAAFFEHNLGLVEQVEALQAKGRRRDLLAETAARHAFYDRRLPPDVYSGRTLDRWRHGAEKHTPRLLFMGLDDLLLQAPSGLGPELFPDAIELNGHRCPLEYRLEPGHPDDGVTVTVPVELVNQLDGHRLDWLVPGRLEEKITALIKGLPKAMRRGLVPAPDYAAACADRLRVGEGPFLEAVATQLEALSAVSIPRSAWRLDAVPDHLHMNVRVVDPAGEVVASGRDLGALRQTIGHQARGAFAEGAAPQFNRRGVTRWDFGELPEQVPLARAGLTLAGYPTLEDEGNGVALTLADSRERAERGLRAGLRRLGLLQIPGEIEHQAETMPGFQCLRLHLAAAVPGDDALDQVALLVADRLFLGDAALPRNAADFEARVDEGYRRLWETGSEVVQLVAAILEAHQRLCLALDRDVPAPWADAVADIDAQVAELLIPGFITRTPWGWLAQLPRYLAGAESRFRKLANGGHVRDARAMEQLRPRLESCRERARAHAAQGVIDPHLEYFRWMLEEMRVSLFAQELGTAFPVSPKRLEKRWANVR